MVMKCQNCGADNDERHIYCDRCGAVIVRPFEIDEAAIRGPRQDVVRAIDKRDQTDAIIPVTLVWLIIVLVILGIVSSIVISILMILDLGADPSDTYRRYLPGTFASAVLPIISEIITLYVYYMLVKRENDHYSRERELRTAIISLIKSAATTQEKQRLVDGDLMTMNMLNRTKERYRRPWFWVLVIILPLVLIPIWLVAWVLLENPEEPSLFFAVMLIASLAVVLVSAILQFFMLWFLGKTMFEHSTRWSWFSIAARTALSKLGFPSGRPFTTHTLPERSFVLYLVLSFVTLGIFYFYWLYALVKDPNEHFKYQGEYEDNLADALGVHRLPVFKDGTWVP